MIRAAGTLLAFLSALFFPWPLTAGIALGMAVYEPLVPFAAGVFMDTLYYVPHSGAWPLFSLSGALVTIVAFSVRGRLKAGIIER